MLPLLQQPVLTLDSSGSGPTPMVTVVSWLAVISAGGCQAPLIPAFEPAREHCCLPCLSSRRAPAVAVSLQNGDALQC